ncbi:MAG TPA: APC family permease [Methanoregulaceae archaeon]|nr:MAG: amino acid permease [Methanolinea sp.]HPD09740.1 APC family permease [Methanoregulaceae archaeon]HRT14539.1 APC family permease [Methanoregulaceae archaeon]HRU30110.1 APC family permease [Methanoregulaceae archaeon]
MGSLMETGGLSRSLGFVEVTLSGIGIILGAGIYALIGTAAAGAGNAVWLSFAISAVVALFTALSYAELSSMFPKSGAEYEYTAAALGEFVAFVVGWLIIFSGIVGAATVALGFGGYLGGLLIIPRLPAAIGLIVVLSVILVVGVRESALLAGLFTVVEGCGLVLVIIAGLPYLGKVDYFEMPLGISGVFTAAALVFFAYMGFEEMVKFSEETTDPERTVPRALMVALAVCTVLYVLVCFSAVSVVGWEGLAASDAPFAAVAVAAWGPGAARLLSVIALFATANTVLLMLLASSRISYGMARSGTLPRPLARVHATRRTPWVAVIVAGIGACIFLFPGDIEFVANVSNFTLFVTFLVVNASVIILRLRDPGRARPFRVPGRIGPLPVLPFFGIASCLFLFVQLTPEVIGIGTVLAITGCIVALFAGKRK